MGTSLIWKINGIRLDVVMGVTDDDIFAKGKEFMWLGEFWEGWDGWDVSWIGLVEYGKPSSTNWTCLATYVLWILKL